MLSALIRCCKEMIDFNNCTLKEQKFAEEYVKCGDSVQAVKSVYPNIKDAPKYAYKLMRNADVTNLIRQYRDVMADKAILTYEYKLQVLLEGIKHYVDEHDYSAAARLIEVSNKMQGHNAAEKTQHTITIKQDIKMINDLTQEYLLEYQRERD